MSDIGERLPVEVDKLEETHNMKCLWVESKVKELESKILGLKRQLEGAELLKDQYVTKLKMMQQSIPTKEVK